MPILNISDEIRHELIIFRGYLRTREYTSDTITSYSTYLSRFLRKVEFLENIALGESIEAFLETENENYPQMFIYCRAALRQYFKMVTGGSIAKHSETVIDPVINSLLQRFRAYSSEIKHLREATVISEISHVQEFLTYAKTHNSRKFIEGLQAEDVRGYIMEHLAALADSSKGRYITSIRNFFRCQLFYGEAVHPSILRLPLSPAIWKRAAFPTTIDADVFHKLHRIPDEDTETGKRDRCIVLCFTELALRCCEVATLALDDFDWRGGYVTVRNTKNGSGRTLPLSAMMSNALVGYLMHARPTTSCRTLFIRFSHQKGTAMGCGQIRNVIRRIGEKAGLDDWACGTHILRRTAATLLYNAGNSLKLTADILGHESLDSTTHYAKADISGLLSVASPWPGGDVNAG